MDQLLKPSRCSFCADYDIYLVFHTGICQPGTLSGILHGIEPRKAISRRPRKFRIDSILPLFAFRHIQKDTIEIFLDLIAALIEYAPSKSILRPVQSMAQHHRGTGSRNASMEAFVPVTSTIPLAQSDIYSPPFFFKYA
ncbi:hypothetical protein BIV19_15440 [Intestinimonas butyriciproducens]|nr:hypothetical protein BIV19_15440 [Intestinimonas butyriciproducens]